MMSSEQWILLCGKLDATEFFLVEEPCNGRGKRYTRQMFGTQFVDKLNRIIDNDNGIIFELNIAQDKTWLELVFICGDRRYIGNRLWIVDTPTSYVELMELIWHKQQQLGYCQYRKLVPLMKHVVEKQENNGL